MSFLTPEFLSKYHDTDFPGSSLGSFVFLRTYSRWLPDKRRRETWKEVCTRVTNYSLGLYQGPASQEELQQEAEFMFDSLFNLRVFPAGRTLWIGGTEAGEKYGTAHFNCAFLVVDRLEAFNDLFHLLMVGCGVGFRVLPDDVVQLPVFNTSVVLANKPYHGKSKSERIEFTQSYEDDGSIYIIVGDSKEGWVQALDQYLKAMVRSDIVSIIINYDSVRPRGELLKTFGGRASGHEALRDMFKAIHKIITKTGNVNLKPVQVMDIMNIIGYYVVVGGVRRTSEICLFHPDDTEILNAKKGLWIEGTENYGKFWRGMSNNSIYFTEKPTKEYLQQIFETIKDNGEPGFINADAASKRRPWFAGVNPCAEILLADRGVCNLSEVNLMAFTDYPKDKEWGSSQELLDAVELAVRIGMRQTNKKLDLPEWDITQKRDRLTGVSITGVMDYIDTLELSDNMFRVLQSDMAVAADLAARQYASEMRIPTPLLTTAVKPSGTISQLPTVSSGVHRSFAPYYIRRVRITSSDPLARVMLDLGYPVYPENGQGPLPQEFDSLSEYEQMQALQKASTWVIEFPVRTKAKTKASEETALDQLQRYLDFQQYYTDHNTSCTVTVGIDEWNVLLDKLYEEWDNYIGVSFLPKFDTGNTPYPLMPYEALTEDEYNTRFAALKKGNITELLITYERNDLATELLDQDCENGVCPIR